MFEKLFVFSHKRNWQNAVGFYIFYLFFLSLGLGLTFLLLNWFRGGMTPEEGLFFGKILSTAIVAVFMFAIVNAKRLHKDWIYLGVLVLSGFLAYMGGLIFGLIPAAYVTTVKR